MFKGKGGGYLSKEKKLFQRNGNFLKPHPPPIGRNNNNNISDGIKTPLPETPHGRKKKKIGTQIGQKWLEAIGGELYPSKIQLANRKSNRP